MSVEIGNDEAATFALPEGVAKVHVENGRLHIRLVPSGGTTLLSILPEAANAVTVGFYKPPRKRSTSSE